ncbi:MAG TPA: PIG-L deacetylase family protein [Anaerolineae bacterium]|nr:PIG-L deacetylase family protein [Anaerolineae bacterium]
MSNFDAHYVPKSAMTIFAHPDDAEFSVAGTVAKWARDGCEVTFVACTSGNVGTHDTQFTPATLAKTREKEQKEAAKLLGVKHVVFLRHDDCRLEPTLELRRELVREIRKRKPEVVLCGDPDAWFYDSTYINHPDHRAAAAAALEAVFPCAEMELLWPELGPAHKVSAVYVNLTEAPNTWIDITDTIDLKVGSLKCHPSQMGEWDPGPMVHEWAAAEAKQGRKKMKAANGGKAKKNKKQKGKLKYAEAFRVMRLKDEEQPPES